MEQWLEENINTDNDLVKLLDETDPFDTSTTLDNIKRQYTPLKNYSVKSDWNNKANIVGIPGILICQARMIDDLLNE